MHKQTLLTILLLLALLAPPALAQGGYGLSWWTQDGGGGTASAGGGYTLGGTLGQPDAGDHAAAEYTLLGGFWDVYPVQGSLAIAKTAADLNGPPLYEGDIVAYTITLTNTATTAHTSVIVQDAVPTGTTYLSGSADPSQTSGPNPLVWRVAALAAGESRAFSFRVTVNAGMAGRQIGGNVAAATSDQQSDPSATPPVWPPGGGDVEPAPELSITKTAADLNGPPLYEGDAIAYTVVVSNPATVAHSGVTISDALPISTTYVAGSAAASRGTVSGPDPLVVDVGALAPGEVVTLTFKVTVDAGAAGRVVENEATARSDRAVVVSPPVAPPGGPVQPYVTLVKVGGDVNGPPLLAGDQVEYHVLVFNPATITTTQLAIEDWIPEHTTYLPGSAATTRGAISGPDPLRVDVDAQPGLEMTFFKFRVTVDPVPFVTPLTNTAAAAVGAHEPVTDEVVLGPIGGDDVGLIAGKMATDLNGPPLYEGDQVEYTIGLANTDDVAHTNVVVTDAIPYGTTYLPGSADPAPANAPQPLVWTVKRLPPKEIVFFTFRVVVDQGMAGQEIGGNVALAASDQQDEAAHTLPVYPPPVSPGDPPGHVYPGRLSIHKTVADVDGPPLYEGDALAYTITVTNRTTDTTYTNVVVEDALPAGLSYVAGSAAPAQTSGPDPLLWRIPALGPGESRAFTFRVTVDEGTAGQAVGGNVAAVTSDQDGGPLITPPVAPPETPLPRPPAGTRYTYLPVVTRHHLSEPPQPPGGDGYEPDGTCGQATPIILGAPQTHTFDPAGDVDWFRLAMTAGKTYIVQSGELQGGADTIVQLYAGDCIVLLAENDDYEGNLWSRVEWQATETGAFYLRVRNYDPSAGGDEVRYTLGVQELP